MGSPGYSNNTVWGSLIMHIHCSRNTNLEHDNGTALFYIHWWDEQFSNSRT